MVITAYVPFLFVRNTVFEYCQRLLFSFNLSFPDFLILGKHFNHCVQLSKTFLQDNHAEENHAIRK